MADNPRKLRLLGAISGLLLGSSGALMLTTAFGYAAVKSKELDVRADWHLAPVVVAAKNLDMRAPLTMDDVAQRSIPHQLAGAAIVKPDEAGTIVNQRLLMFVAAGEPFRWSMFWMRKDSPPESYEAHEACAAAAPSTIAPPSSTIRTRIAKRPR